MKGLEVEMEQLRQFVVALVGREEVGCASGSIGGIVDDKVEEGDERDARAVGCIFGELLNSSPLFPGEKDIEQLCCVLRILGTPNEHIWPGMSELPDYNKITFPENQPVPFEEILPDASPEALDLLRRFLVYPSKQRIPAKEALLHPYFFSEPLPAHHSELPIPQRTSKKMRRVHQAHEYNVDTPLVESLLDPDLIAPHVHVKN
ncbi:Cyclin-dependent kinase 20 [Lamellibrachia satsuma]|nr:Cyclin-dependent kinase 20 [Lamellibrachia satsuma]